MPLHPDDIVDGALRNMHEASRQANYYFRQYIDGLGRIAELEAENTRLRAALEAVRVFHNDYKGLNAANHWSEVEDLIDVALAADA